MRFSDRTISYDTGLNLMQQPRSLGQVDPDLDEVGIVILPHNGAAISDSASGGSRPTAVKKISTGKRKNVRTKKNIHFLSFSPE